MQLWCLNLYLYMVYLLKITHTPCDFDVCICIYICIWHICFEIPGQHETLMFGFMFVFVLLLLHLYLYLYLYMTYLLWITWTAWNLDVWICVCICFLLLHLYLYLYLYMTYLLGITWIVSNCRCSNFQIRGIFTPWHCTVLPSGKYADFCKAFKMCWFWKSF